MRKEESFLLPRIVVESLKFSSSCFSNWSSFICSKLSDQKTKIRRLRVQTETRDILALPSLGLGFLVDFLSHAALVGFMAGATIMICLQQLKGLLGITHFTNKTDAISILGSVYKSLHHQLASGFADKVQYKIKLTILSTTCLSLNKFPSSSRICIRPSIRSFILNFLPPAAALEHSRKHHGGIGVPVFLKWDGTNK
ncbi:Low affinity sulfate transporter 3 [Senna tora]|uniref:Low affinity sulfate transporter 3 n=1 Tax=Senna tora TaxID=362788 RepID=A0A834SZW5_9FABA|nr:Low affinity sulfate transporter 3 [Senna tora]